MIRSVEFDLVTKSEANQRFASKAGMFAKSSRVQKQRAAVRDVLAAHHTAPRCFVNVSADPIADDARSVTMAQVQASLGATKPNRITVRLTRIAPGELDDDNLRGALKAVRDAIAAWIGTNDRDPLIAWEYGQERAGSHVYRVRVQLTDLAPGADRRVVLAETTSEGRAAASRIKRLTTKAAKGATNVKIDRQVRAYSPDRAATPTTPDAAFRAASHRRLRDGDEGTVRRNGALQPVTSSGRAAAEAAFAKVTARDPRRIQSPAEQDADTLAAKRAKVTSKPARPDPDAEAMTAMRDLARSQRCLFTVEGVVCGALPGQPCRVIHDPAGGPRAFQYGVHGSRAHAAGLPPYPSAAELNAGVRPVRVTRECDGCRGTGTIQLAIEEVSHGACHGSGKVAAWRWEVPMSRADMKAMGEAMQRQGQEMALRPRPKPDGDPGEERPARDLAPCTRCGVGVGWPCQEVAGDIPGASWAFGVHVERAKAAGVMLPRAPTPTKAPTTGVRKFAPVAEPRKLPAWVALPWTPCEPCGGGVCAGPLVCKACQGVGRKLTREPRRDGADPPRGVRYRVPAEHVPRFGPEVVLTRRPHVDASGEPCWLYA